MHQYPLPENKEDGPVVSLRMTKAEEVDMMETSKWDDSNTWWPHRKYSSDTLLTIAPSQLLSTSSSPIPYWIQSPLPSPLLFSFSKINEYIDRLSQWTCKCISLSFVVCLIINVWFWCPSSLLNTIGLIMMGGEIDNRWTSTFKYMYIYIYIYI